MATWKHSQKLMDEEKKARFASRHKNSVDSYLTNIQTRCLESHNKKLGIETTTPTPISQHKINKQVNFVESHKYSERDNECVLITNNPRVKEAFDKMNRNDFKTIN